MVTAGDYLAWYGALFSNPLGQQKIHTFQVSGWCFGEIEGIDWPILLFTRQVRNDVVHVLVTPHYRALQSVRLSTHAAHGVTAGFQLRNGFGRHSAMFCIHT